MSMTSIHHNTSINIPTLPSSHNKRLFTCHPPSNLTLPRAPLRLSVLSFARHRSNSGRPATSKKNKSRTTRDPKSKEGDLGEDAFEALFKQLEEDLKKDGELLGDDEDDISEEELAMLERELEEALAEDEDIAELLNMATVDTVGAVADEEGEEAEAGEIGEDDDADYDYDEEELEEEEEPIQLKGWQLRRLAQALKVGRRKTSIKNLAAELCLDRAIVLEMLREPPPNLLMMCAALPDIKEPPRTMRNSEDVPPIPLEETAESADPEPEAPNPVAETPIHALQDSWSAKKRLKKVQVETLENVYKRTKRPTNAMISSVVHVTNLPRRRVVQWFEEKRAADGVPEQHHPYRRSASESVFAQ